MTDAVKKFIEERAEARAKAASELAEELEINGIRFGIGCDENGIPVTGLEKLMETLGLEKTGIGYEPYAERYVLLYIPYYNTRFYEVRYDMKFDEMFPTPDVNKPANDTEVF